MTDVPTKPLSSRFVIVALATVALATFTLATAGCGESHEGLTRSVGASSNEPAITSDRAETLIAAQSSTTATAGAIALNRKIIYNTDIGLVVQDYKKFENELPALVNAHGGFVASNHTNRRYNDNQSGEWMIRVPVVQYSSFLSGINALGFAETRNETAQDVTEEYVDIEARIKNKRALEGRVLGILEDRSGKLNEILEIERELSRVREEIERMEGRIRFLKERTSLATITIRCREQQEYQPAAAPTLTSRLGQSFSGSIETIQRFVANLMVFVAAVLPWAIVLLAMSYVIHRSAGDRIRGWLANRSEATS